MRNNNPFNFLLILLGLLGSAHTLPTQAAGTVTNCDTFGATASPGVYLPGTLGAALVGGGNITFACSGTIIVPEIILGADTVIDATGQNVTLSGNNTNPVLQIRETRKVDLINLKITQGAIYGGIRNFGGTVTLTNCTVSGNTATSGAGGGISNQDWQDSVGMISLIDTTVSDNSAAYSGGGIYNDRGAVTLTRSTVSTNSAAVYGGGIYNSGTIILTDSFVLDNNSAQNAGGILSTGQLTLINTTVSGNRATHAFNGNGRGGGISIGGSNYDDKLTTITNSVVSNNSATSVGGGIYFTNGSGTVTIANSTVSNNTANSGGGIANLGARMTISNSTISGNTAGIRGGGIFNFIGRGNDPHLTITNSTLSGNTAGTDGGGIHNYAPLTLTHVTFAGNSAARGSSLYVVNNNVAATQIANTLIATNSAVGNCVDQSNLITDAGYNLSSDGSCNLTSGTSLPSTDPNLGPLADHGGPTLTHALVAGSPAINAGNNSLIPAGVTTDQRGDGFPRIVGGTVDIGAVEFGGGGGATHALTVGKSGGNGTVTSSPSGINCGATCSTNFNSGTSVTLTASADSGYSFTGWSSDCNGTSTTCTVTMDRAKSVIALFTIQTPDTYTLTVSKAGTGSGTVTSNPVGIDCGVDCSESYPANTVVTLTATPYDPYPVEPLSTGARHLFAGWSGACTGVSTTCTITMDAAKYVTATFNTQSTTPDTYTLTLTTAGTGSGTVSGAGSYAAGAMVTLTATPNAGSIFVGWSPSPCASLFSMPANPLTCTATFSSSSSSHFPLTVTLAGNGLGTITSQPSGIQCSNIPGNSADCSENYPANTAVTLTALPANGPHYFVGWSGPCTGTDSCTVTLATAQSVTATFGTGYALTINRDDGGAVARNPTSTNCTTADNGLTEQCTYAPNTAVALTATPVAGKIFNGWSGACTGIGLCQITMTANQTVTAAFVASDPVTALITHYYQSILERAPEADGLAFWQGLVAERQAQGADVKEVFRQMADFFFNSPEYIARNTTDRQFITNLYLTFFQREPDEGGYAFWLDQLAKGMSRNQAMRGFLYSPEFTDFMERVLAHFHTPNLQSIDGSRTPRSG